MKWNVNWKSLLLSLILSFGTGAVSSLFSPNNMGNDTQLYRPYLAPPGWVFPVVWTILYLLLGIASYLVWESTASGEEKQEALILYGTQLVLQVLWVILFFRWKAYVPALLLLMLMWYFSLKMVKSFWNIQKEAGWLLIPYQIWLTFALYLNFMIASH